MDRIKYLERKFPNKDVEDKYQPRFQKEARYVGNGIYTWCGQYSRNPRELFLMGVLISEGIKFNYQ